MTIDPKKLLTEEGWKDVAPDCKGKDKDLLKALFFYWSLEDDDFDFRVKALTKVAALAAALKTAKEVTADPDAVKYLVAMSNAAKAKQTELLKAKAEAAKTKATQAAADAKKADAEAKKAAEAGDGEEEEEEEETADAATKLKRALQSLKTAKMPYYFLVCDAKPYGLIVSKKDITKSAQAKKELAQLAGGSTRPPKFGECRFDGGKLVFEMEKPPSGLARILQKWVKQSTGLGLKVMVGTESAEDEETPLSDAPQLHFKLSASELAACNQYLAAHFDALLSAGSSPVKPDSYQPGLDGKPVKTVDVIRALMPLTLAGSQSKDGKDQMFRDTVSQLDDLVEQRFTQLSLAKSKAAMDAATKGAADKISSASAEAEDWVRNYLRGNDLKPDISGDGTDRTVMFNNKTTPMTTVVNTTLAAGRMANLKSGDAGRAAITTELVSRVAGEILEESRPKVPSPGGSSGLGKARKISMYLQYTFTPKTVHTPVGGGADSSDQPAHAIAGQITMEFHAENEAGWEVSSLGQVTWFADEKGGHIQNQSGFTGAQVAWVWSFLDGALQAGPLVQALVGAARAQQKKTGKLEWAPTGQVAAGGQLQYAIPGFDGKVLVGIQAGVSGTDSKGSDPTVDKTIGITLTYKFGK